MAQLFVALTMRGKNNGWILFFGLCCPGTHQFRPPPSFTRSLLNAAFVRRYNNRGLISVCNQISKTRTALRACCKCHFLREAYQSGTKAQTQLFSCLFHLKHIHFATMHGQSACFQSIRWPRCESDLMHDSGAFVLHSTVSEKTDVSRDLAPILTHGRGMMRGTELVYSLSDSQERIITCCTGTKVLNNFYSCLKIAFYFFIFLPLTNCCDSYGREQSGNYNSDYLFWLICAKESNECKK